MPWFIMDMTQDMSRKWQNDHSCAHGWEQTGKRAALSCAARFVNKYLSTLLNDTNGSMARKICRTRPLQRAYSDDAINEIDIFCFQRFEKLVAIKKKLSHF